MATPDLDPNAIAAEFLSQRLDSIVDAMKDLVKETGDKVRLRLDRTYRIYLTALAAKYSKAKSFMLRGESVPLYKFYVHLDLTIRHKRVSAAGLREVLSVSRHAIITGSGGSGKSMFIRHLLMDALSSKVKVPVFIELRQFNGTDANLVDVIKDALSAFGLDVGSAYIDKALQLGHFLFFLDGYDEVAYDKRDKVATYILDFVRKLGQNDIIVTSRWDSALEGWQDFAVHSIAPLNVAQARAVIERLSFDEEMKQRFIRDLQGGLFDRHQSFLSNPLLLSIMLLSYGQSAGIPSKLSVFYNQAYEALFERHDALKDGYRRQLRSGLDIQDFSKLFAAFCLRAYDKAQVSFSKSEVLEHIDMAQELVGMRVNRNCYFQDLTEAVCLLVEDGIQIVYPHRSFQEYFAARFICDAPPNAQEQLIQRYTQRGHTVRTDVLLTMLHEMRPDVVERYYLIPCLSRLLGELGIKGKSTDAHARRYQRKIIEYIYIHDDFVSVSIVDDSVFEAVLFALKRCGSQVGFMPNAIIDRTKERDFIAKYTKDKGNDREPINPWKDELAKSFLAELRKTDGSAFSINALQALQSILQLLVQKARSGEQSLEKILQDR